MSNGVNYAGGLELKFFPSANFEENIESDPSENRAIIGRNVLRLLMMGWQTNWRELISWQVVNAVFFERDHQLNKAMRLAFQHGFNHIFSQLEGKNLTTLQHNQAQLFINNCLAYLPLFDPTPYESFAIAQFIDNQWQLVDYKVVPIELTPTSGFKKLFLADNDRVFAYGLEPIANSLAQSHLIFGGTTYPAGQGFATEVNTDLESFETAGKSLFRSGYKRVTNWIDAQNNKVHVCGVSLGGALSLLLAIDQGQKLSRVDALDPPGLYSSWQKSRFDRWDDIAASDKPIVIVQKQGNDPVSKFGVWKPDWTVLQVTPPEDKKGPNALADHTLNYAGFSETTFITVDAKIDNDKRKWRNFWLYTVLRSIWYVLVMIPCTYVVLPTIRSILHHKLQLALTAALLALVVLAIATGGFALSGVPLALIIVMSVISAIYNAYFLANLIWLFKDFITHKMESDFTKISNWFSKQSIFIKAMTTLAIIGCFLPLVGLIGLSIASSFIPVITPLIISIIYVSLFSLPLLVATIYKVRQIFQTLFGKKHVDAPVFLDPSLPRNKELDINKNTIEAVFSRNEIRDYYRHKSSNQRVKFELEKYEKLTESESAELEQLITVKASKAIIYDMKQTVRSLNRFGINHGEIAARSDEDCNYKLGRP